MADNHCMPFTPLQVAIFRRSLIVGAFWVLAAGALTFWVLVSPANPVTAYVSAPIAVRDARVITGPYPRPSDFDLLRRNGVTTIISLLDPALPYERVLLSSEEKLGAENGMTVRDFPMGSLFDRRFGADYELQARAAASAAEAVRGRVYIHSYLGIHRVAAVEALLGKRGAPALPSSARAEGRTADAALLEQAQRAYDAGDFRQALRLLFDVVDKSEASQTLSGWADYRLGDMREASDDFSSALRIVPGSASANIGLGYCALRDGDLGAASTRFATALAKTPRDVSALTGMGLTRYRQGRKDDALRYLRMSLAIDPHDADAREALSRI